MSTNGKNLDSIGDIVARHGRGPENLIQILHDVQASLGHVPESAVRELAEALNLSRADVHGVVSYYHDFRSEPAGRHVVKICQAEACQAMGCRELTAHAESALGVGMHGTTDDVTLEPVYCLGNCALAPAVMIDGKTFGRVREERFDALIAALDGDAS
jgi:formate dehydrogenase subunit gamma